MAKILPVTEENRAEAVSFLKNSLFTDEAMRHRTEELLEKNRDAFRLYVCMDPEISGALCMDPEKNRIVLCAGSAEAQCRLLEQMEKNAEAEHISRLSAAVPAAQADIFRQAGFETERSDGTLAEMEYLCGRSWLAKTVTVSIDHPYGSFHPHLPDVTMPVNAGYVLESMDSGELIDAYVYGIDEPLETYTGTVGAVIYRREDGRMRFAVVPKGMTLDHDALIASIAFAEQYHDTRIIWADQRFEA